MQMPWHGHGAWLGILRTAETCALDRTIFHQLGGTEAHRRPIVTQRPPIQRLPPKGEFSHSLLEICTQNEVRRDSEVGLTMRCSA
jgi:hypothetical protein